MNRLQEIIENYLGDVYAFKVYLRQQVYHNGEYSHTNERTEVIYSKKDYTTPPKLEELAPDFELRQGYMQDISETFTLAVREEYVYTIVRKGKVKPRIVYDFE